MKLSTAIIIEDDLADLSPPTRWVYVAALAKAGAHDSEGRVRVDPGAVARWANVSEPEASSAVAALIGLGRIHVEAGDPAWGYIEGWREMQAPAEAQRNNPDRSRTNQRNAFARHHTGHVESGETNPNCYLCTDRPDQEPAATPAPEAANCRQGVTAPAVGSGGAEVLTTESAALVASVIELCEANLAEQDDDVTAYLEALTTVAGFGAGTDLDGRDLESQRQLLRNVVLDHAVRRLAPSVVKDFQNVVRLADQLGSFGPAAVIAAASHTGVRAFGNPLGYLVTTAIDRASAMNAQAVDK